MDGHEVCLRVDRLVINAEVMKLADMRALEARARKGVQVQILSSAPIKP